MKPHFGLLGICSVLLLSGCGTILNHTQYQVLGPVTQRGERVPVPATDRETVKQIMQTVATEFHLEDRTASSLMPDVIGVYSEPDNLEPISFAAWTNEQSAVVVDLFHEPSTIGETQRYRQVRDRLYMLLTERFGNRVVLPPKAGKASKRVVVNPG